MRLPAGLLIAAVSALALSWLAPVSTAQAPGVEGELPPLSFDDIVFYGPGELDIQGAWDDFRLTASGGVVLRVADLDLFCDSAVGWFRQDDDGLTSAEIYAEGGPVVVIRGIDRGEPGRLPADPRAVPTAPRQLQGDRIFINLLDGSGLMQKAAVRSLFQGRTFDAPLQLRADEIRIAASGAIEAHDVIFSTCEFGDPHWRLNPKHVVIQDGKAPGLKRVDVTSTTVKIGDTPVLYIPKVGGNVGPRGLGEKIPFQRIKVGRSSAFGAFVQTDWGGELTEAVDWRVELDGYTERGVGVGADFFWEFVGGRGFVDTYLIDDQGEDSRFPPVERSTRGRVHALHRQEITDSLRLDMELSYISDRSFLDEWFEGEAKTGKEQETYAYLRYLEGDVRGFGLGKVRLNEFANQVESLPQFGLDVAATPLLDGRLYYDSTSDVGNFRAVYDNFLGLPPDRSWRGHTEQVIGAPVHLGPVRADVYAGVRQTGYEQSPGRNLGRSRELETRTLGVAGGAAAINLSRIYEVDIPALDVHRLRHVMTPKISYQNVFALDSDPEPLYFFNVVDALDELQIVRVGLLNRLQTRRAISPELEEGGRTDGRFRGRPEEVVYLDLEAILFPEAHRDNAGDVFGGGDVDLTWRLRRGLTLTGRAQIGGGELPTLDELSLAIDWRHSFGPSWDEDPVDRTLDLVLAHRHRDELTSATTLDVQGRVNRKFGGRAFLQADWETGRFSEAQLVLERYTHDFVFTLGVEWDDGEDDLGLVLGFNLGALSEIGRRGADGKETPWRDFQDRTRSGRRAPVDLDGIPDDQDDDVPAGTVR